MKERFSFPSTIEEILENPNKYGVPTFEQFRKSPDTYRPRKDRFLAALSKGPENFRKDLKKIRYFSHGLELKGEEEVEKMLLDHGYSLEDIDLEKQDSRLRKTIDIKPVQGGLDHEMHICFFP